MGLGDANFAIRNGKEGYKRCSAAWPIQRSLSSVQIELFWELTMSWLEVSSKKLCGKAET
jgi:hypothetical protein